MPISPTIQLTLRGILVLLFNEDAGTCEVGFLKEPPADHVLTIDFTQRTATGTPQVLGQINENNIQERLQLVVENVSRPGVHAFTQLGFNRSLGSGDRQDFRWSVNYEELFEGEPEVNLDGFRSILTINNGKFFTEARSIDDLHLRQIGGPDRNLGRVATAIGAQISLDREDSRAVFMNGDEQLFEYRPEPGVIYAINISQSPAPPLLEVPTTADANAYRSVINPPQGMPQIEFLLPPVPPPPPRLHLPVSQYAVCFTAVGPGRG
jgi:hypothetical protein